MSTDAIFSSKTPPEPTAETFSGWGYDFVSIKIKKDSNTWKVYGIDKQYILRVIVSEFDFTNPQQTLEIPYVRNLRAMCFGDTKDVLYFCSRDKLCSLTEDTITEIVTIQGESFSHMAYKDGYIYVTTDTGIDIYSESLHLYQYTHVPSLSFHRLYGIVSIDNDLYIQTDDTLFSVNIEKYGMLSDTHRILLTGLTVHITTLTGIQVLSIDITQDYYQYPNMDYQLETQMTTLCFSTYVNGMNILCFYSLQNTGRNVYFVTSDLFTIDETTLYFYTPTEWKSRGPIPYPIIRTYEESSPTTYRIGGLNMDNILDVFIQDEPVEFNQSTRVLTSTTTPRTITATNGFFANLFYFPFIEKYPTICSPGDVLVWRGNSMKRALAVKIGDEIIPVEQKNDVFFRIVAPQIPDGMYTVDILGFEYPITQTTIEYSANRIYIDGLSDIIGKKDDVVSIRGERLNQIETIQFGSNYSEITRIDDTLILLRVPIVYDIVPIKINQQPGYYMDGSPILFYEIVIEEVSPLKGMVGDIITVRGTNLTLVNNVAFGDVPAILLDKQHGYLKIKVPTSFVSTVSLFVNQSMTSYEFQYVPYEINKISVYDSNQQVTFQGKGLMNVTSLLFGAMDAPIVRKTYNSITVSLPTPPHVNNVLVTFQNDELTLSTYTHNQNILYTYIPKIYAVSDTKNIKGSTLVLTGIHLNQISELFFGKKTSVFSEKTNEKITLIVPDSFGIVALRAKTYLEGFGEYFITTLVDGSELMFEFLVLAYICGKKKDQICLKSIYSYPSNQLSTKRVQANMIRLHTKVTYNNSRLKTVYNFMLGLDYVINRNLLFEYKYKLYTRYLDNLLQGNITLTKKQDLAQMLQGLIASLTPPEYNFVFELTPPVPLVVPDIIEDSYYTFYVVQRKMPDRTYFIFKNISSNFLFDPLRFYTFDVSDPSNLNSKLSFSEENYSSIPYRGIEYISTPGTSGAKIILSIYRDIPALQLYVYNALEQYPIIQYLWGYSTENLPIHLDNGLVEAVYNFSYINARQYSYLSIYESSGPKFSINDSIAPVVFLEFNQYHYTFTYGTYYLDIPKTYASTLLNKGYEKSVSFIGESDKKTVEGVYGTILATKDMTTVQEGPYDFYYGRVQMTVYSPIPVELSFYSRSFGFMGGMNLVKCVDHIDISDEIGTLPYYNTLQKGDLIRLNGDTSVKPKTYGLNMGVYVINIDPSMNIAFLNAGKEDLFEILSTSNTVTTGPFKGPDGRMYTFYSGRINIAIKGWFETMSLCTTYNYPSGTSGYSGGYKLLVYNGYRGPPSVYTYTSLETTKGLCSQNNLNIYDSRYIYFNDDYDSAYGYGLYNGVYTIYNIPSTYPVTLLNKNKEMLVRLEGLSNNARKGTGPDGHIYTFYYGTLRFTVHGNFGKMSLYTLFNGYMGGLGLFTYGESFNNSISYPDVRSIPTIPSVPSNTLFTDVLLDTTYVPLSILLDGDIPLENTTAYSTLYTYPVVYNTLNITTTLAFNSQPPSVNTKYTLKNGIYILDSSAYVTLLNTANDRIKIVGVLSQSAVSSDGYKYTYYRGNTIAIYVFGNFGLCSLEVLGGPLGNYLLCHEDNIFS